MFFCLGELVFFVVFRFAFSPNLCIFASCVFLPFEVFVRKKSEVDNVVFLNMLF